MLKADSVVGNRIDEALAAGVKVLACENTMRNQKLAKDDMLPKVGYVALRRGRADAEAAAGLGVYPAVDCSSCARQTRRARMQGRRLERVKGIEPSS